MNAKKQAIATVQTRINRHHLDILEARFNSINVQTAFRGDKAIEIRIRMCKEPMRHEGDGR